MMTADERVLSFDTRTTYYTTPLHDVHVPYESSLGCMQLYREHGWVEEEAGCADGVTVISPDGGGKVESAVAEHVCAGLPWDLYVELMQWLELC